MQKLRAEHRAEIIGRVDPSALVFVDESGCNRAMTRPHARSLCGPRARGNAPRNWGDNVSIVGALSLPGPLTTMHMAGASNGDAFWDGSGSHPYLILEAANVATAIRATPETHHGWP